MVTDIPALVLDNNATPMYTVNHNSQFNSVVNAFKASHNILRDGANAVGHTALQCHTDLVVLCLCEKHFNSGVIDIDNLDYYNTKVLGEENTRTWLKWARFSNLIKFKKNEDLTSHLGGLRKEILSKHPQLKLIYPPNSKFGIEPNANNLTESLGTRKICHVFYDLIQNIHKANLTQYSHDILGEAYEEIIKDEMVGRALGQFFTPTRIKNFMIDLINPKVSIDGVPESIFDPAMGTGGFLISALRYMTRKYPNLNMTKASERIGGRELHHETFQLCRSNILISSGRVFKTLELGDSLRHPISGKYDIVLTNPPFGVKGASYEDINLEGDRDIILPIVSNNAISLFIQQIIHILKIGGRCVTVLPDGQEIFSRTGADMLTRKYLLKTCDVREIISIPANLFANTTVKTCVAFFFKSKEGTEILTKQGTKYNFAEGYATQKVSFYEFDPETNIKKFIIEADIENIIKNGHSLGIGDYTQKSNLEIVDGPTKYKMSDLVKITTGKPITKDKSEKGPYPVYGGGESAYSINQYNRENKIVIAKDAMGSECVRWIIDKFFLNHHAWTLDLISDKILEKYLYYCLKTHEADIYALARGIAQKGITQEQFYNFSILVPIVDRQKEIIIFCDRLVELNRLSKLTIDNLKLSNNEFIQEQKYNSINTIYKLSELVKISIGKPITKLESEKGPYPVYGGGDPAYSINKYNYENRIVVAYHGMSKTCVRFVSGKFYLNIDGWALDIISNKVLERYLYYYLKTHEEDIYAMARGLAQKGITHEQFYTFPVLIPSVERQKELLETLETNNTLINMHYSHIIQNEDLIKDTIRRVSQPIPKPTPEVIEEYHEPPEFVEMKLIAPKKPKQQMPISIAPKKPKQSTYPPKQQNLQKVAQNPKKPNA